MGYLERVLLSPSSEVNNCFTGLDGDGETFLAHNTKKNYVHFFQKNGKNSIKHYSVGEYAKRPSMVPGSPFHGHFQIANNSTMKKVLGKFDEIYRFKTKASAKRFRDMLKAFD